jgi:hypothetical protein
MTLVDRYVKLLGTQLLERALEGGALSQDREGEYVDEFEHLWDGMTAQEQETIEAVLAILASIPAAPPDLRTEDVRVEQGEHELPRKAA